MGANSAASADALNQPIFWNQIDQGVLTAENLRPHPQRARGQHPWTEVVGRNVVALTRYSKQFFASYSDPLRSWFAADHHPGDAAEVVAGWLINR